MSVRHSSGGATAIMSTVVRCSNTLLVGSVGTKYFEYFVNVVEGWCC